MKILLIALLTAVGFSQVTEEWLRIYEGNLSSTPFDMTVDELGNVYITGTTIGSVPLTGNDFTKNIVQVVYLNGKQITMVLTMVLMRLLLLLLIFRGTYI